MRQGVGIDLGREPVPDETTIISAPSSTKNRTKGRDPEMHQTKKGQQWYVGMNAHIGVDSQTKLSRSVTATAANGYDSQVLLAFLQGQETRGGGMPPTVGNAR